MDEFNKIIDFDLDLGSFDGKLHDYKISMEL